LNSYKYSAKYIEQEILNKLPSVVLEIAEQHGYELYAVGGSVRDSIIGNPVVDLDLAVVGDAIALAQDVANKLNAGKVVIYRRFGTAMLHIDSGNIEFAASRKESYLPDSHKPAEVIPVPIEEDLRRRDFTINTLALGLTGSHQGELLDLFNGQRDIADKVIQTPLDPDKTFSDDPLRMLRAIRFTANLGFTIALETWDGIVNNTSRLRIVAYERIRDEFWKMLEGDDPIRAIRMLIDSGLMSVFLPEVTNMKGIEQVGRHHHKDVLTHSLRVMQNVVNNTEDPVIRLAGLLHDVGKPLTKKFTPEQGWTFHGHETTGAKIAWRIGRRLRLGKEKLNRLTNLISLHMRPINLTSEGVTDSAIRRMMVECGTDLNAQLILCRADITTANPTLMHRYLANFKEMQLRMGDVEARNKMRKFQSPIRGDEIMKLCGIEPGPIVGALKEKVEDAILDGIIPDEYDAAKEYLLKIKDEVIAIDPTQLNEERRTRSYKRRHITSDYKFP